MAKLRGEPCPRLCIDDLCRGNRDNTLCGGCYCYECGNGTCGDTLCDDCQSSAYEECPSCFMDTRDCTCRM
jgi:hypothetical protein